MNPESLDKAIGARVRVARKTARMSMVKTAEILGMTKGTYRKVEVGVRPLKAGEVAALGRLWAADVSWLLYGRDMTPKETLKSFGRTWGMLLASGYAFPLSVYVEPKEPGILMIDFERWVIVSKEEGIDSWEVTWERVPGSTYVVTPDSIPGPGGPRWKIQLKPAVAGTTG